MRVGGRNRGRFTDGERETKAEVNELHFAIDPYT